MKYQFEVFTNANNEKMLRIFSEGKRAKTNEEVFTIPKNERADLLITIEADYILKDVESIEDIAFESSVNNSAATEMRNQAIEYLSNL